MQRWTEDLEEGGRLSLAAWRRMARRRRATGEFLNLLLSKKSFLKNPNMFTILSSKCRDGRGTSTAFGKDVAKKDDHSW